MVDLTADVCLSAAQSSLSDDVQTLLKEMNSRCTSQKGWSRWNLEKKVEVDPSSSVSLIRVLVKELGKKLKKIHKTHQHMHVIPILHTLYYVVIQSVTIIPANLYQRVCECLLKLLILPLPYSAVALSTLRSIRMEMTTPGSLYTRRVIAEQNLRSKHFTMQEKVFVLADPSVFSAQLEAQVRASLEASSMFRDTATMERNVLVHVLHKGLGTDCQSSRLTQTLEVIEDKIVKTYFEEVVQAVEQSIRHGAGGYTAYLNKLQHIQRDVLTADTNDSNKTDSGSVCSRTVSYPEIKFIMWTNEVDLCKYERRRQHLNTCQCCIKCIFPEDNLLANFTLRSCSNSMDKDEDDMGNSEDGEVRRHREDSCAEDTKRPRNSSLAISRRNAYRKGNSAGRLNLMTENIDGFPGSSPVFMEDCRRRTARVVVMGDNRVLGRLTKAYHSIRDRESKHLTLTKRLNLQLYYIPVTDVEPPLSSPDIPCQDAGRLSLSSLLGQTDPWYNSNINSLRVAIAMQNGQCSNHSESTEQNHFLLDTLCYYLRCGTKPVNLPLYSVKMTRSSCDVTSVVEEVFVSQLEADIPEFRHLRERFSKPSTRRKNSTVVVHGGVITVKYTETSLSKRKVVRGEAPMSCGVVVTSEPAATTAGEDYLTVRFDRMNPGCNTKIKSQNISIRTMEHRSLSVCLDKDSRRTYTDVQKVEISPCLDPGCSIRSMFTISSERALPLSKYLNKVLSLPINTFTGVTL
ncbi:phosphoinositide 3-kinase regulatory subunit 6 isoform X2 [Solea solea]|uniref:phosphoinositide 3-kinase regulatory subunit 6 isoform X2 n=1 Tax=Solea solea TaxID=90069 RepID=UPI00272D484B|nr:phosphoinositide 3-kinase regulatory subunit 6 isoform X2 [Solea solea]